MLKRISIPKIREFLFYLVLTIELVVALVEKSDLYNPYESYIFRITFLITLLIVIITPYNVKEWICVIAFNILGFYCYMHTGRNDLWRIILLVLCCKTMDMQKSLKYFLYVTLIGSLVILFLSVTGIYGEKAVTSVFRANEEAVTRYCFGFGHPNGLQTMAFVITALFFYVYRDRLKIYTYIIVLAVNSLLYYFTDSRTSYAITIMLILGFFVYNLKPDLAKGFIYSIGTIFLYVFSVGFSLWAAVTAPKAWGDEYHGYAIQYKIDAILNGRINSIYANSAERRGWAGSWSLFSDSISTEYFDMGWVRLYYWYGIIPASLIVIIIFAILVYCIRKKDMYLAILIAIVAVYTIIEAHFVSDYNGRNFILLIIGTMWSKAFYIDKTKKK